MVQDNTQKIAELSAIRELIDYWRIRRDEAEKMVSSLIREERVIQERR